MQPLVTTWPKYLCLAVIWIASAAAQSATDLLESGDLVLDRRTHTVSYQSEPLFFQRQQFSILERLMASPGKAIAYSELVDLSHCREVLTQRALHDSIYRIRERLRQVHADGLIENVTKFGFRFHETSIQQKQRHLLAKTQRSPDVRFWGPVIIDDYRRSAFFEQRELDLSRVLTIIFEFMASHNHETFSVKRLAEIGRSQGQKCSEISIPAHIKKIREELGPAYQPLLVVRPVMTYGLDIPETMPPPETP